MFYKIFLISSLFIMISITIHFVKKSDFESYFTDIIILILYAIFFALSLMSFIRVDFSYTIIKWMGIFINYIMLKYCIYYIFDDAIEIYYYYIRDLL